MVDSIKKLIQVRDLKLQKGEAFKKIESGVLSTNHGKWYPFT